MTSRRLRLGTRGSKLAMWQSHWVKSQLEAKGHEIELIQIKTEGDLQSQSLVKIGGQGLFTKRLQVALLENEIDFAVHSLKDLPTEHHADLTVAAVPKREDPRDVLLSVDYASLADLPEKAIVGTGSVRRAAQLRHARPDLDVRDIRGNVDTRIEKLKSGQFQAIILANAGLLRLGLTELIKEVFEKTTLMPAVGQGALGIEIRTQDQETKEIVSIVNDEVSFAKVIAEREMLRSLQGGCLAPIGVWTTTNDNRLQLEGTVLSEDGQERIDAKLDDEVQNAVILGQAVASQLKKAGAERFLN